MNAKPTYQPSVGDTVWCVVRSNYVASGPVEEISDRGIYYVTIDGSVPWTTACVKVHPDEIGAQEELLNDAELTAAVCRAKIRKLREAASDAASLITKEYHSGPQAAA